MSIYGDQRFKDDVTVDGAIIANGGIETGGAFLSIGELEVTTRAVVPTPAGSDEAATRQFVLDNAGTPPSISVIPSRDHAQTTALNADDHTQYHNNARGDARYYTQAQIDALIAGISPPIAWDSIAIVIRHFVDASAGPQVVNLPASAIALNQFHVVKKIDASGNTVTAVPDGSDTVEGDDGLILENQGDSANLLINGTNWEVV